MNGKMIYKETINRKNIEDSLVNHDDNELHRSESATKEFLDRIKKPELGEGIIVPGALTLAKIEFLPEIKDYFPLGISDIEFSSPLVVKDSVEVSYIIEEKQVDSPVAMYSIEVREKERKILSGKVFLTDKHTYSYMEKKQLEELVKDRVNIDIDIEKARNNGKEIISDSFEIRKDMIETYCRSLGVNPEEYYNKYGDKISGMMVGFFIPARLVNMVSGNKDEFFAYRNQSLGLFNNYNDTKFELTGIKDVLKNTIYNVSLIVKNIGSVAVQSKTRAVKILNS